MFELILHSACLNISYTHSIMTLFPCSHVKMGKSGSGKQLYALWHTNCIDNMW